ncbi:MAG: hypothetical protein ACM33T_15175 [Solirubrobacterales bacterium]
MKGVFITARQQLEQAVALLPQPTFQPLPADQWIVASTLQKAIRRGDADLAERAALTYLGMQGASVWRRLQVIAFEDVGSGSADAVVMTVAASLDAPWREKAGGNARVAATLARMLADAPKDRSADYLICAAKDHPSLEEARARSGSRSLADRLALVADTNLPLPVRAIAAWYASGVEWGDENRVGKGDLSGLLATFRDLGVPDALASATVFAATRTREPITVMVPLVWLAAFEGELPDVMGMPVPDAPSVDGVPMWALDKHTRVGKQAIHRFARECASVRACLEEFVPEHRHREAACLAAFYADAAPVSRRLAWSGAGALEGLGTENDLLLAGVASEGIDPLLATVRANLDHLNEIRTRLFEARQYSPAQANLL